MPTLHQCAGHPCGGLFHVRSRNGHHYGPMTQQETVFLQAAQALDQAGILWWLSDGAALGCHREGRFLPTDPDLDIGFWQHDQPAVTEAFNGWTRSTGADFKYLRHNVKIDLHGHQRQGDHVWFPLANGTLCYTFPAHLFNTFHQATFYGQPVLLPSPPTDYLTAHYGRDWHTPQPAWQWDHDPPCLTKGHR